jgi:hypothetical protein
MTYENAPATKMIATHCACCGRPLVDAVSVETGMGPHCRKKHGFSQPDTIVEVTAAVTALAATLPADLYADVVPSAGAADFTRVAANRLVHRIACLGDDAPQAITTFSAMVNALRELGFLKLAARITARWASIRIEEEAGELTLRTPFNEAFVPEARAIPGRRWVKPVNVFPASSKPQLWAALRKCFAGRIASGPKGLFVIA